MITVRRRGSLEDDNYDFNSVSEKMKKCLKRGNLKTNF